LVEDLLALLLANAIVWLVAAMARSRRASTS
jgi:hypothetical protein